MMRQRRNRQQVRRGGRSAAGQTRRQVGSRSDAAAGRRQVGSRDAFGGRCYKDVWSPDNTALWIWYSVRLNLIPAHFTAPQGGDLACTRPHQTQHASHAANTPLLITAEHREPSSVSRHTAFRGLTGVQVFQERNHRPGVTLTILTSYSPATDANPRTNTGTHTAAHISSLPHLYRASVLVQLRQGHKRPDAEDTGSLTGSEASGVFAPVEGGAGCCSESDCGGDRRRPGGDPEETRRRPEETRRRPEETGRRPGGDRKRPMADSQTLFSFELFVEDVRLDAARADMVSPAVGVRLLDFPTLLIYPSQNRESRSDPEPGAAQSSRTTFLFSKGKSCLFRISLDSLHRHTRSAPLCSMLLDVHSDIPRLVGSSLISLANLTGSIKLAVDEHGIGTPAACGERFRSRILNLMGENVGIISLSCKIVSLGSSLIPHVVSESKACGTPPPPPPGPKPDSPQAEGNVDGGMGEIPPCAAGMLPETKPLHASTQTGSLGKRRTSSPGAEVRSDHLCGTFCPPPLFYSSSRTTRQQPASRRMEDLEERLRTENLEERLRMENLEERLRMENLEERLRMENLEERLRMENLEERLRMENLEERLRMENLEERLRMVDLDEDSDDGSEPCAPREPKRAEEDRPHSSSGQQRSPGMPSVLSDAVRQLPLLSALLAELSHLSGQMQQPPSGQPAPERSPAPASGKPQSRSPSAAGPTQLGRAPPAIYPAVGKTHRERSRPQRKLRYGLTHSFRLRLKQIKPGTPRHRDCSEALKARNPSPKPGHSRTVHTDRAASGDAVLSRATFTKPLAAPRQSIPDRADKEVQVSVPSALRHYTDHRACESVSSSRPHRVQTSLDFQSSIQSDGKLSRPHSSASRQDSPQPDDYQDDFTSLDPTDGSPDPLSSPEPCRPPRTRGSSGNRSSDSSSQRHAAHPVPVRTQSSPKRSLRATHVIGSARSSSSDDSESGSSRTSIQRNSHSPAVPRILGTPIGEPSDNSVLESTESEEQRDELGSEEQRDELGSEEQRDELGSEEQRDELGSEEQRDELGSLGFQNKYRPISELVVNKLPGYTL
ncbi:hypothetical protein NFI96_019651 [Prochilodus magdalenae]|nr:hypothetical protein NFI96_019651 [Prochilodus magdalenae]